MFLISTSRGLRMLALVVLMAATGLAMMLAAAPTTNAQAGRSATIKQVTLDSRLLPVTREGAVFAISDGIHKVVVTLGETPS